MFHVKHSELKSQYKFNMFHVEHMSVEPVNRFARWPVNILYIPIF